MKLNSLMAALAVFMLVVALAHPAEARKYHRQFVYDSGNSAELIGGRPAGCPHAYCGCGLRKYLGIADARLNLAWNWARLLPRVSARPGAAAVRHHHVMLLEHQVSGTVWVVRDYNGGRHLSYVHERDVRGYVFVDPHSRVALK